MGSRRRFTPEYRRDVASLVLDTGSTNCVCGPGFRAGRERGGRRAAAQGRPDPREMEAEITALRRRVRQLEKENEFLGKANAFFASRHQNTSALN